MEKTLKLNWLGHPLVEWKGRPVKLETRKAAALLAYLSLEPQQSQREVLATMLWPEGSQQKALANLRRTLASLNASVPGWIEADHETIRLKRNAALWVDVEEFHRYLLQFNKHHHPQDEVCEGCLPVLEKAVDLYQGDFLEGLNLGDCPGFDEWQFFSRDGLRQEFAEVLQRVSSGYAERSRWDKAISCARRWVTLDRLHEPACRLLMELYARSEQRSAALRQYEELARLLDEQLGQEPEPETRRLYEQIRGREGTKSTAASPRNPASFPLLKTKLYIPAVPASRVIRTGLIACMSEVERKSLTILSAPAGFGKTTLLAEWIAQTSMPVAWLSLDNRDNESYRFLAYLIAALESIQDGVGTEARQIMQSPQLVPPHIILASLINDLGSLAESCVLVLDDYQFITEHPVHEMVAYLLDYLPSNLHLVISTRADPPLQLGRFRAHGQMLELRTHDLRFTPAETVEFLNDLMKLKLSAEDIEALENRTEGWVVGLKMAALSLQGRADASEFIRAFSGSHRYVLDYLVEEVLKRQPAPVQKFLLQTSILEKLNGPLCDVLMPEEWRQSGESGQSVLEHLARNNLFLISVDEELNWFRYHHLFADLLRGQLQKTLGGEGLARLHLLAATWHEQHGLILDAIHHASLASDDERVERLIRQNYLDMMNRGELSWVRSWMGSLSRELVYHRPWLCLYEAMNRCWFGQLDEANVLLYEADKRIQEEAPSPDKQSMLGYHSYVKSRVTAMQGDTRQAIEFCIKAREIAPADRLDMQIDFSITLGYEYFLYGDFINAGRILNETIQSGNLARAINNPVAAYCLLARSQAYQGKLHQAEDLLQKAAHVIGAERGHYLGVVGLLDVETAALLCEWNDLETALSRVKRGLDCLPWWGKADDFCLAYVTLARIQLARGNLTEAVDAVRRAVQLVETCGIFSEARSAVQAAQVKLWLLQRDWTAVNHWIDALEKRFESREPFQYEDELAHITQARVFIAQKKPEEAIRLLCRLEEIAGSSGRMGRLIEIILLEALVLEKSGNSVQAINILKKGLVLARPEGYMRIFLDEGKPMIQLLKKSRASVEPLLKEYIDRLLEAGSQHQA